MDHIKMEPFSDPAAEQRENLLFLLGKMREMQAARGLQSFKRSAGEREGEDQPLDFSAPAKTPRLSPDWLPCLPHYPPHFPDNKHDTLGSDGVSDVSSHSPGSNSGQSESGREPRPGSTSPPRPALARLHIPDSPRSQSDLLTTTNKLPLLKPLSSLVKPESSEVNPLLSLAGLSASSDPVTLSLPFNLPVFPQTVKPSFVSSLPFSYQPPPAQEMNKISMDSQEKYAEFREKMMKNIETGRKTKKTEETPGTPNNKSQDESLEMTPTHHSTPRDGKDAAYWERRRKNNEAAKRSRDARRHKENEIAVRASYLEQENIQLKMELVQLRTELGAMRDQVNRRPLQQTC